MSVGIVNSSFAKVMALITEQGKPAKRSIAVSVLWYLLHFGS